MLFPVFFSQIYFLVASVAVRTLTSQIMSIRNLFGKARNRFVPSSGYAYNSYDNREGYYQNLLTERSGEALLHWLGLKDQAVLNPRVEVNFKDINFQRSPLEVRRQLGKPRFVITNPLVADHEIHFYRFRVTHLHSVVALHFLDQQFFMANHSFRQLTAQNHQQIVEVLTTKYGLLPPPESIAIKDRSSNTVLITDGLYLTVKYISGHPLFEERIQTLLDEKNRNQQRQRAKQISSLSDFL